ncbi:nuclear receptor corepressor 1-like [Dermacentor silvarum]|uniref:nuclear receptor corepressor 1-like n=1 Tax=Dermacentor silvarum TaxID=543639 RepID=UPI0021014D9E|nr:nuclear receptor corepressor 1-like [Dermacentor silvarum]
MSRLGQLPVDRGRDGDGQAPDFGSTARTGPPWRRSSEQVQGVSCRNFYFNYKRKLGLDEIVRTFREARGGKEDGKRQVTDDEDTGETTTSCEEDNGADHCSSDTASACSPSGKQMEEGETALGSHLPSFTF